MASTSIWYWNFSEPQLETMIRQLVYEINTIVDTVASSADWTAGQ